MRSSKRIRLSKRTLRDLDSHESIENFETKEESNVNVKPFQAHELTQKRIRELGIGTKWMEAAAWKAVKTILDDKNEMEWIPLFDGLNADLVVKFPNDSRVCGIQVKSRQWNGKPLNFSVTRKDAKGGQKWQHCVILAITIEPVKEIQLKALDTFNQVPKVQVLQLVVYRSALEFPTESLQINPKRSIGPPHGDHIWTKDLHGQDALKKMKRVFFDAVHSRLEEGLKMRDFFFGVRHLNEPNVCIGKQYREELYNIECLVDLFGLDSIQAPLRGHETVDIVLLNKYRLSLKTATKDRKDGSLYFVRSNGPFDKFCNGLLVFYREKRKSKKTTHLSVLDPSFGNEKKRVLLNSKQDDYIMRDRITLNASNACDLILSKLELISNKCMALQEDILPKQSLVESWINENGH